MNEAKRNKWSMQTEKLADELLRNELFSELTPRQKNRLLLLSRTKAKIEKFGEQVLQRPGAKQEAWQEYLEKGDDAQQLNPDSEYNRQERRELEKVKKMEKALLGLWIVVPSTIVGLTVLYLRKKQRKRREAKELALRSMKL